MNKSILWLIGLLFVTSLSIVSCSESDGTEDKYADWEVRNQRYIDSIATVAEANQGEEVGQWKIIRSYKLPALGLNETGKVNDNVYCKIIWKSKDGGPRPLFKDTVGVDYRGKLMDGTVFDQNYKGDLESELKFTIPSYYPNIKNGYAVDLGTGAKTATMQMQVGDRWEVYIPYDLGYGEEENDAIPGYSTLIFDWYLAEIIPLKGIERSLIESLDADVR